MNSRTSQLRLTSTGMEQAHTSTSNVVISKVLHIPSSTCRLANVPCAPEKRLKTVNIGDLAHDFVDQIAMYHHWS
jgi:hypothetical protein